MSKKTLFFDVDGTLMNENMEIPESVGRAFTKLHENGHNVFICSGRAKPLASDDRIEAMGIDGYVCGGGTLVEFNNEELEYYKIPRDVAILTVETIKRCNIKAVIEGRHKCYVSPDFDITIYPEGLQNTLRGNVENWEENYGEWEFSKFAALVDPEKSDLELLRQELEPFYNIHVHSETLIELLPKGYNKGRGVKKACEHLNVPLEDTYGFGDSVNDIEMLRTVGTAVVMGNGSEVAKKEADYITESVDNDGIYKALEHLGLI